MDADNPTTKEKAAMEPMAGNDDVTVAKTTMRPKNLLAVKVFAMAEVMTVDMTVTQSMAAKGRLEAAGLPQAPGEMTRPRAPKVARPSSLRHLGEKKHQKNGSD